MNIQKFTQKSVEAINDCEKLAYEYGNRTNISYASLFFNPGKKINDEKFRSLEFNK